MDTQTFLNNFGAIAQAPNGIDRLRNLVLGLAIQGQLVDQDPSDGLVAGLLSEIATERRRLASDTGRRSPVALLRVGKDEELHSIPESWRWVRFGEVQMFTNGFAFKSSDYQESGVGIVRMSDLKDGRVSTQAMKRVPERFVDELLVEQQVRPGDLLIGMSGSICQPAFNTTDDVFLLNQRVGKVEPILVPAGYVVVFLRTMEQRFLAMSAGSAIKNLSTKQIREAPFPCPPLAEQHRIVAKVDELMTLCDELETQQQTRQQTTTRFRSSALDSLVNAELDDELRTAWGRVQENWAVAVDDIAGVDRLRELILSLAIRGELCEQRDDDEPASGRLAAVKGDPAWRLPARERRGSPDPTIEEMAGRVPVPEGWVECRMEDCVQLLNGRAYKQHELLDAGTPVIRIQNLNGGNDWYYSDLDLPEDKTCVAGDLLFAWSASFGPYIWSGSRAIFHYHIWKIRLSPAVTDRYLYRVLEHLTTEVRAQSHGLAMLHMTKGKMERWPILLPPIAEQQRIVAKVDELMGLCDRLEASLGDREAVSEKLSRSVTSSLVG
ncbi:restriction endonuclease subunit S [Ilumatobacter sp.]|nr:restriction endonuclease subunit S [Ilumatobacter sp.]